MASSSIFSCYVVHLVFQCPNSSIVSSAISSVQRIGLLLKSSYFILSSLHSAYVACRSVSSQILHVVFQGNYFTNLVSRIAIHVQVLHSVQQVFYSSSFSIQIIQTFFNALRSHSWILDIYTNDICELSHFSVSSGGSV